VSYTVAFHSNGGTIVPSQSVNRSGRAEEPAPPTRTGYAFAGWYSDSELTQAFSFSAPITSDLTLYARWLPLNAFVNGGFESPVISNFIPNLAAPGWSFIGDSASIASNGSDFGNMDAPEVTQAAILQMEGIISQTVYLSAGTYNIRFYAVQRYDNHQNLDVYLDDTLIGNFTPAISVYTAYVTDGFTVTEGAHTVKFVGKFSDEDHTAFIDLVQINEAAAGQTE